MSSIESRLSHIEDCQRDIVERLAAIENRIASIYAIRDDDLADLSKTINDIVQKMTVQEASIRVMKDGINHRFSTLSDTIESKATLHDVTVVLEEQFAKLAARVKDASKNSMIVIAETSTRSPLIKKQKSTGPSNTNVRESDVSLERSE